MAEHKIAKTTEETAEALAIEAQKTVERVTDGVGGATAFGQENFEAMVESTRIAARAFGSINPRLADVVP